MTVLYQSQQTVLWVEGSGRAAIGTMAGADMLTGKAQKMVSQRTQSPTLGTLEEATEPEEFTTPRSVVTFADTSPSAVLSPETDLLLSPSRYSATYRLSIYIAMDGADLPLPLCCNAGCLTPTGPQ